MSDSRERIEEAFDIVLACVKMDKKPWMLERLERIRDRVLNGTPGDGRKVGRKK